MVLSLILCFSFGLGFFSFMFVRILLNLFCLDFLKLLIICCWFSKVSRGWEVENWGFVGCLNIFVKVIFFGLLV